MLNAERTPGLDTPAERFDQAVETILISALLFMPFAYGVVEAWSEEIVLVLAAALSVCVLLKTLVIGRASFTWTWAYVPVVMFITVVVLQLIPMPPTWIGAVSPHTVEQKTALLRDLPEGEAVLRRMTMSFYPWATRHDLRLVLAVAAVFAVVLNVYRRPEQIMRLLAAITAIGAAVALLALAQNIAGNDKIYWCVSSPHGSAHSGPFVNHSHYAQFMNLSIGAALGFIFVKVHQRFRYRQVVPGGVADYLRSSVARPIWGAATMVVLGMASVFIAMSRGGMISMLIAGAATVLILSSRKALKGSGWVMVLLALAAFICVLGVGFDAVHDRLGSLGQLQQAEGGRWQILKDIAVAWTRFPLLGTGLGTHGVVYPMFDRSTVAALASHAENEYAQTAEETGAVGLLALGVLMAFVWRGYGRAVWTGRSPIHSAAYGLGFGLIAVTIHSLSDFGQHLPANGILSAVFCALIIRLRQMGPDDGARNRDVALTGASARRYGVVGLLIACPIWGWVLADADAARRSEQSWKQALAVEAGLVTRNWLGTPDEYIELIRHAQAAAEMQPDNVTYRYWLPVYRWRSISQMTDPNTGAVLLPPRGDDYTTRIVAELNAARACCPSFGATWSVLGQLERLVLDRPEGEAHIQMGYKLAPCDPTACLLAGTLDAEAGRIGQAFDKMQRAVELNADYFSEVATFLVRTLKRPDLALDIAGVRPDLAGELARMLDGDAVFAEEIDRKLLDLLDQKCCEEGTSAYWHAMLAALLDRHGQPDRAIESYEKALEIHYGQVQWRLRLAQLLSKQGRVPEAIRHANICLQLSPDLDAARRLIAQLSIVQTSRAVEPQGL